MNHNFLITSTILHEISSMSLHDKQKLFDVSVKLAKKGVHSAIKQSKKKYHKKQIKKKIQKNTERIYNKMINADS